MERGGGGGSEVKAETIGKLHAFTFFLQTLQKACLGRRNFVILLFWRPLALGPRAMNGRSCRFVALTYIASVALTKNFFSVGFSPIIYMGRTGYL